MFITVLGLTWILGQTNNETKLHKFVYLTHLRASSEVLNLQIFIIRHSYNNLCREMLIRGMIFVEINRCVSLRLGCQHFGT